MTHPHSLFQENDFGILGFFSTCSPYPLPPLKKERPKSKIHPPALGLEPPHPKKGENLKKPKMLQMNQKSFWL